MQLYAETADAPSVATVVDLETCLELAGSVNGFKFSGETTRDRPLDDYSVRIVPHHPEAYIPIEQRCILWNR